MRFTISIAVVCLSAAGPPAAADGPVTYQTHVRKIFRDHCASCHNRNRARAGLDLTSYGGAIQGSSSGRVLMKNDPEDSVLYLCISHQEQPAMPPGKDPLDDEILETVRIWIETGLPENPGDVKPQTKAETESVMAAKPSLKELAASEASAPADSLETRDDGLAVSPVYQGPRQNAITALAVSPNSRWAAVSGQLQVLVFDLPSRSLAGVLPFPEGEIFALRFSADSRLLLAGGGVHSESGRVVLWDLETGSRIQELGDEYDVVMAADLSPDGSTVLLGGPERIVKVIDVPTWQTRATLTKHTDWILSASFSPEGLIFATSDRAGNVYVWETGTAESMHTLRGHRGAVTDIDWTSDGNQCITVGEDGTVRFWDMHTGEETRQWSAHDDGVLSAATASTGELITAGRDDSLKVWSADGNLITTIDLESTPLHAEIIGEKHALTGDWSGQTTMWELTSGGSTGQLGIDARLLTSDLSRIDRTVESPEAPLLADSAAKANSQGDAEATSPDPNPGGGAAQSAMAAHERLRQAVEQLPTALVEMQLAERSVQEARDALVLLQQSIDSMEQTIADWSRDPAAVTNREFDRLGGVKDALAAAQRMIASIDTPSEDVRQIAVLTALALEKAEEQRRTVEKERPAAENPARQGGSQRVREHGPELVQDRLKELRQAQQSLQQASTAWSSSKAELTRLRETIRTSINELDGSLDRWSNVESTMRSALQTADTLENRLETLRLDPLAASTTTVD